MLAYMLLGRSHAARLIVSIASYDRATDGKRPDGPIVIFTDDHKWVESWGLDSVWVWPWRAASRTYGLQGRNNAYVAKPSLANAICNPTSSAWGQFPISNAHWYRRLRQDDNAVVFLDADTFVASPHAIGGLWRAACYHARLVLTGFSDWTTATSLIAQRVSRWRSVGTRGLAEFTKHQTIGHWVASCQDNPITAVNTGVFAFTPARQDAVVDVSQWHRLTNIGGDLSFPDELAAQLLVAATNLPIVSPLEHGHDFNASPVHVPATAPPVAIWHGHGNKHALIPGWMDLYRECLDRNFGSIRDLPPEAEA